MKDEKLHIDPLEDFPRELPFKVPESYFDDFEARLNQRIQQQDQGLKGKAKIVQILKPILWLAASFLLVFLLVYYPMNKFLPEYLSKNNQAEEEYPISIESLDDDAFYDMITDDLHAEALETDDILDYLTTEISEYEIYTEMYN